MFHIKALRCSILVECFKPVIWGPWLTWDTPFCILDACFDFSLLLLKNLIKSCHLSRLSWNSLGARARPSWTWVGSVWSFLIIATLTLGFYLISSLMINRLFLKMTCFVHLIGSIASLAVHGSSVHMRSSITKWIVSMSRLSAFVVSIVPMPFSCEVCTTIIN